MLLNLIFTYQTVLFKPHVQFAKIEILLTSTSVKKTIDNISHCVYVLEEVSELNIPAPI